MMVLHQDASRTSATMVLRRKRSKGTIIASYSNEAAGGAANGPETISGAEAASESQVLAAAAGGSGGGSAGPTGGSVMTNHSARNGNAATQPQHRADASPGPSKTCHSAQLALMCVENAIRMGARTQLFLCPPGRVRQELQENLRQRGWPGRKLLPAPDATSYYGLERLVGPDALSEYDVRDEEFLITSTTFDDDSIENASSGDEDEMCDFDDLFSEEPPALDDLERYLNLSEPLFVSAGAESALSNPNGGPMSAMGPGSPGKLPFNRRKIRFFDAIDAQDARAARLYVRNELKRSKRRATLMLTRQLRKVQLEERRKRRIERGEPVDDLKDADNFETPEEKALLNNGVEPFPLPMSPTVSAALLIESLSANPLESVEGMSKCYDGIVAAGVALLDAQTVDPTSLTSASSNTEGKGRTSRSEIMAALTPLLISSLEQPSGEVILVLAKLRRMCGTPRYQRRFVQRVAPALIRPPRAAIWCLRHQNDMEAILAATEMIFDSAFDVFSKGWYERGQLLLADSKRAETLNSVAKQLRDLSSEPAGGGFALGLPGSHGSRRRRMATTGRKGEAPTESLSEWEVIAVDRQIRLSISSVLSMDWSRTHLQSEIPKPHNRRATVNTAAKRTGISVLQPVSSTEMSPKSFGSSPRSPTKAIHKTPQSPPHMSMIAATNNNAADSMENVFGPSFSNQFGTHERALSPPPPSAMSSSPPPVQRSNSKEMDTNKAPMTPPRSPKSPVRHPANMDTVSRIPEPAAPPALAPLSPKRGKPAASPKEVVGSSFPMQVPSTPLSPSASSVGTAGSGELITYKPTPSSASSMLSSTAAHYRMLTSTAAERKRTVAACRALRAQIQRFEDAFIQLHGRPPKGQTERAPLATTYAQYREWKRAIRADAACRIQALFRGASTRWGLLRLNNPPVTRVVMKRAGRAKGAENIINQISIPVEIGQTDHDRSPTMTLSPSSAAADSFTAPGQTLAPQWASKVVRRRSASERDNLPSANSPSPPVPKQYPVAPASPTTAASTSDLNSLSLSELQARKRDLKQQLKQYDMSFARKHGRMPVKAEKEPIRHLYESYNALKSQIHQLEHDGRPFQPAPASPVANSSSSALPQRSASSPPSGSESGQSGSEDSLIHTSPLPSSRSKRSTKIPKAAGSPPIAAATGSATSTPDLAALKAEKTQLHQMLRSYEKDFYKEHKRQVSSFADIKPVASQYRRYKEIKKAIAAQQQGEKS